MKNIPVSTLAPHIYFTAPVFIDGGYILLLPDTPVTQEIVDRLKEWNYSHVFTEGDTVNHPSDTIVVSPEVKKGGFDISIKESENHQKIMTFYFDFIEYVDTFINNFLRKNDLDIASLTMKIKEVINTLKEDRDYLLGFTAKKHPVENYLIPHIVNSTLISLGIGEYLKLPPHKLIDLGLASVLHEIGMMKVPRALYMGKSELSQQEKKTIATHTLWGYRMLKNFSVSEPIAAVALEHHERMDGSGYPRGLKGEAISFYSRIIAVACSFETSVSKRPYKEPVDGHKAMLFLLTAQKHRYDETVLKALVFTLSIFPLGTFVLLSNNAKGIVYKTNSENPKYPVVKLLVDEHGREITAPVLVQTSKETGITIARTLRSEEI
ncbi:MAG: HD-GYP domain-containing protein [Spirochaetales bacterium]|nr:HD-GYP domain-containing protein [Spirochaetales bacterium]